MEMDKFGHPIHPRGLNETKSLVHITNLTFNKLIMKICEVCSFIGSYILQMNIMH
jgi:hypothetical protein